MLGSSRAHLKALALSWHIALQSTMDAYSQSQQSFAFQAATHKCICDDVRGRKPLIGGRIALYRMDLDLTSSM